MNAGVKKSWLKTPFIGYLIITCRQTKIKSFDKRRKAVLGGPKGSSEAHLILVKIYWFMFFQETVDVFLNFWAAIWTDWWKLTLVFFVGEELMCQKVNNSYENDSFLSNVWDGMLSYSRVICKGKNKEWVVFMLFALYVYVRFAYVCAVTCRGPQTGCMAGGFFFYESPLSHNQCRRVSFGVSRGE